MVDVLFDVKISLTFLNEFTLSREEFVGPERPPKKGLDTDAKAELAFNVFDKNHDGFITKNEMLRGSKNLTKEQVSKIKSKKNVKKNSENCKKKYFKKN